MIDRYAGRRQHLAEDAQRLEATDALPGDGSAGHGPQLGFRSGVVEGWRIEPHALQRIADDGLGQDLVAAVQAVHAGQDGMRPGARFTG